MLPTSVPDLKGWWAADKITGHANGATVAQWVDLSGNSLNWAMGVEAKKPTFRSDVFGAKPVLRFDGVDDTYDFVTPTGLRAVEAKTFLAVWAPRSGGSYYFALSTRYAAAGVDNTGRGYIYLTRSTPNVGYSHTGAGDALATTAAWTLGQPYISTLQTKSSTTPTVRHRRDRSALTLTTNTIADLATELAGGYTALGQQSGAYGAFDIAELIMIGRDITDSERDGLEAYLYQKWIAWAGSNSPLVIG